MDSKYLLTFDLRILYCPNIRLAISCQELNVEALEFSHYEKDLNILFSSYEIKAEKINNLVKNILNGKIGNELEEKEMLWVQKFEKELNENENLLKNEKLIFNYLILKLKLLGFEELEAQNFVKTYFKYKIEGKNIPTIETFITAINKKLNNKVFWVCNNLDEEKEIEIKFIHKILNYKNKLMHNFDFNLFKDEYLNICEKSFINKIYKFNNEYSYLVTNPLFISDQKTYLTYIYKVHIYKIFEYLLEREFKNLSNDKMFINALISDMSSVLNLFLEIKETKAIHNI